MVNVRRLTRALGKTERMAAVEMAREIPDGTKWMTPAGD
jgi:hypothetical protein